MEKIHTNQLVSTQVRDDLLARLLESLAGAGEMAYIWDMTTDEINWLADPASLWPELADIHNGSSLAAHLNPQDVPFRVKALNMHMAAAAPGKYFESEYRLRQMDGSFAWMHEQASILVDKETGSYLVTGTIRRMHQNRTDTKTLENLVVYDQLSGAYNRRKLQEMLAARIVDFNASQKTGKFVTVGIDRLSLFNEAFGADIADAVISGVAQRLDVLVSSENGILGRLSGDVFGIILPEADDEKVAALATRILSSLCTAPVVTPAGTLRVSVSMGGVCFPFEQCSAADVIARSERALQMAKEQGRGCYISYAETEAVRGKYRKWLKTGESFIHALDGNRIALAYQPVVDAKTGKVAFYECLVRMISETGSVMNAGEFIPAVEHLGHSRLLDLYTLKLAVEELKTFPDVTFSINLSAWTLTDPAWLRRLIALLQSHARVAERIIIEITETMAMRDVDMAAEFVDTIRSLGCRVALDDFGAGHTSFSQIKRLGVDIIKIDKYFIKNFRTNHESQLFVKALQGLADGFRIQTVGEGAETVAEAKMLQEDGVNYIQGYAYGFPSLERSWLPKGHPRRMPNHIRLPDMSVDSVMKTLDQAVNG